MPKQFEYHGITFYLNTNRIQNEYTGKYILLYWNVHAERWMELGTCDGFEDAKGLIDNWGI